MDEEVPMEEAKEVGPIVDAMEEAKEGSPRIDAIEVAGNPKKKEELKSQVSFDILTALKSKKKLNTSLKASELD